MFYIDYIQPNSHLYMYIYIYIYIYIFLKDLVCEIYVCFGINWSSSYITNLILKALENDILPTLFLLFCIYNIKILWCFGFGFIFKVNNYIVKSYRDG